MALFLLCSAKKEWNCNTGHRFLLQELSLKISPLKQPDMSLTLLYFTQQLTMEQPAASWRLALHSNLASLANQSLATFQLPASFNETFFPNNLYRFLYPCKDSNLPFVFWIYQRPLWPMHGCLELQFYFGVLLPSKSSLWRFTS